LGSGIARDYARAQSGDDVHELFLLADRRSTPAFWLGSALVVIGVILHLPMFLMAKQMHYMLAGMPMEGGMLWGMACIVGGCGAAAYGLQPKAAAPATMRHQKIVSSEDAPLTRWHVLACAALASGLVIDVMKPAALGFVTPGMRVEYDLGAASVAYLPLWALLGTVAGSFVWGILADFYGRRATILLSAVMFVGTSICGTMPSFTWNLVMCFLMGAAAGGMLPVTYALLAEIMPTRHRGWSLVAVGGIGAVGGYLAASGFSAILQPVFGWRIMWLLNLPTGLLLITLSPLIPESARFLIHIGRPDEAHATLKRFGAVIVTAPEDWDVEATRDHSHLPPVERRYRGTTTALTLVGLLWGYVNFGLLLWLPAALIAEGRDMAVAASIIARSSLIAVPVVAVAAWLYSVWSTKRTLLAMIAVTILGLLALLARQSGVGTVNDPTISVALLIIGSTGVISVLLPYAAENYPLRIRGRATGWIAACSKAGGLFCQIVSVIGMVPSIGTAALAIAIPALISVGLVAAYGHETRGRDLRDLEL
jgi:putative MFS transporter